MKTPRIVGLVATVVVLYGVWLLEPRWITGALGLLVLYALLTNTDRAAALFGQADAGLRAIVAPKTASSTSSPSSLGSPTSPSSGGHSIGGRW